MGAERFLYPNNVGGILGGKNYSPYFVLEIHFDNPQMRNNIVDSSGMRIYYQEKLRKYDAGILEVGLEYNAKNSIPPGTTSFALNGFCLGECTHEALAKTNSITVFASQLHTHLTGRRVWTSIIRKNKEIDLLNGDNHYDQMFQEIRYLKRPVRIRPGDTIINTCVYDTSERVNMTLGGFSIRNEMCVNYLHYYPASELEVCKSSVSDVELEKFFNKMKYYDCAVNITESNSLEENFNSIRWTPLTKSILKRLYDTAPISFSCNSSDGHNIERVYWDKKRMIRKEDFEIEMPVGLRQDYAPIDPELIGDCHSEK
jgi:dopamine beta-monooxygenase